MYKILLVSSLFLPLLACTTNVSPSGNQAKKAGPKDPKKLTSKPSNATSKGMGTKVSAPGDTSGKSLSVPGDAEAELFAWQADVSGDGTLSDCIGAFTDDGSAAIACSPITDTCDDGSDLEATLLLAWDGSQQTGAFALAGSDLCGQGFDVIACDFDADGNIGTCGVGDIVDDHIDVSE